MATAISHPFASIMPGPYSYVGFSTEETRRELNEHRKAEGLETTTNLCGGTCDLCGTAIWDVYVLEGANGKFRVGSTCIKKLNTEGDRELTQIERAINARKKAIQSDRRKARTQRQYQEALAWLEKSDFSGEPHPKGWEGKSLADYLTWYRHNAGAAKFITIAKQYGFAPGK